MTNENAANLEFQELIKKAKNFDKVNGFLVDIYSILMAYNCEKVDSKFGKNDFEQYLQEFNCRSLDDKFDKIRQMIIEGNPDNVVRELKRERKQFEKERVGYDNNLRKREEELLNAWNNFQSWKSETSRNLIKDLNSKFKENV
jgi:hypothetical protein